MVDEYRVAQQQWMIFLLIGLKYWTLIFMPQSKSGPTSKEGSQIIYSFLDLIIFNNNFHNFLSFSSLVIW